MLYMIASLILPVLCIGLLGVLLLIIPQQAIQAQIRSAQRILYPGIKIQTTQGLSGFVVTSTRTHVIIATPDGQKHELLRHLIIHNETSV
jgi:preprotein translocase subunit YajC